LKGKGSWNPCVLKPTFALGTPFQEKRCTRFRG